MSKSHSHLKEQVFNYFNVQDLFMTTNHLYKRQGLQMTYRFGTVASFIGCTSATVVNATGTNCEAGVYVEDTPLIHIVGTRLEVSDRAYIVEGDSEINFADNIATAGENMSDKKTVGARFGRVINSEIIDNDMRGFGTAYDVEVLENSRFARNRGFIEQFNTIKTIADDIKILLDGINDDDGRIDQLGREVEALKAEMVKEDPAPKVVHRISSYIAYILSSSVIDAAGNAGGDLILDKLSELQQALIGLTPFLQV